MSRPLVHGIRWMIRRPLLALISGLCLAAGIAASTTAWTLIHAVILRPYGLDDSDRLAVAWEAAPAQNQPLVEVSYLNFLDWQRQARTLESMAAFGSQHWPALARIGDEVVPIATRGVSESFFRTLGVHAARGRTFVAADEQPSSPPPILLSHRFWQARFAGAPSIVGQRLFVDGVDHVVVGVMPAGFAYPDDPDVWVSAPRILSEAFGKMPFAQQRQVGVLEVLVKRRPDASNDDVRAELTAIVQQLQQQHSPGSPWQMVASVTPLTNLIVGAIGERLWIAFGMSVVVLLLACANVGAARLAHFRERAGELTARMYLGATRGGLVRDLALELLPLVVVATACAALLWRALLTSLTSAGPIGESGLAPLDHWAVAAFLLAGSGVVSWTLAALLPAIFAARATVRSAEQGTARVAPRTSRIGGPLLFSQAALAIAVVAIATATVQTFQRLSAIDLGFSTEGVTLVDVSFPSWKYGSPAEQRTVTERLLQALQETPSVTQAAAVSVRPFRFGEIVDGLPVRRGGDALAQADEATPASRVVVTPGYFAALGLPIAEGRAFEPSDREDGQAVAIISRTLARSLFGERSAVGERIETYSLSEQWRPRLVVGVAGDARYRGLERPSLEVYVPAAQSNAPMGSFVVSSHAPLAANAIRGALRRVEPDIAIERVQSTAELHASVLSPTRLLTTIVSLLGVAGLVLLALGIFGAAAVALRVAWAEIAVRQAMGAPPVKAAAAPLRGLARALAGGVGGGLLLAPMAIAGARALGLSTSGQLVLPLASAAALVLFAAALAIVPSLRRAAALPPAQLLRDAQR